jgi:membrane protein DedA with SNARE-associated domain
MPSISKIIAHFPYLGLSLMLILGGVGFPLPEDTTLILCGFLISTKVIRPLYALLVVYLSLLTADFTLYSFGKRYGRTIVTHKRFHRIISPERLSILEDKFKKRGTLILLLGRHLVGLRAQLFIVAGIMKMPPLKFLAVDAASSIFTMAIMIGAGYIGGHSLEVLKRDITKIEHMGILLAIILLTIYLFLRYVKSRKGWGR